MFSAGVVPATAGKEVSQDLQVGVVNCVSSPLGIGQQLCRQAPRIEVVGDVEILEERNLGGAQDRLDEVIGRVSRLLRA
jgi:hypothetical protein